MKKILYVFDEEKVSLSPILGMKELFLPEETEITAVSYNNDFYCFARSDYEKKCREASVRKSFDMIKSKLSDYNVEEEKVFDWSADEEVLSLAQKYDADAIVISGNTRKMRRLAKRINLKSNITVTLIPELEIKAA